MSYADKVFKDTCEDILNRVTFYDSHKYLRKKILSII